MKGIRVKDLYDNFCILKNGASYVFAIIFLGLIGFLVHTKYHYVLFLGIIAPILGGAAVESSTEQDEAANFNKLQITFPVTKTEIVIAKYILGLGFVGASNLLALVYSLVQVYGYHVVTPPEALRITGFGISISLIFLSVIYVGYFLLGKRWGTIFFVFIAALTGGLYGAYSYLFGLETFLECSPFVIFGCIFAGIIILTLSCLASIKIYTRRYS